MIALQPGSVILQVKVSGWDGFGGSREYAIATKEEAVAVFNTIVSGLDKGIQSREASNGSDSASETPSAGPRIVGSADGDNPSE